MVATDSYSLAKKTTVNTGGDEFVQAGLKNRNEIKLFSWIIYLDIFSLFFFIEPVATEHQSHLLVLEVLLRIK